MSNVAQSHHFYITPEEYELAAQNGIRPVLLDVRVRSLAWKKGRAITEPPKAKKRIDKHWVEVANQNGICYSTLRYRVNRLGWNIERAATQPLQDRKAQAKIAYEKSRKYPVEYLRLAAENGIKERTFHRRVEVGWDLNLAATRAPMTGHEIGLMTKAKREKTVSWLFATRKSQLKRKTAQYGAAKKILQVQYK
ncbi:hypothetical protein [Dehalobacter restrictus]|uniref:hypothetical protein n=1 Tax=Dehalobacter restrictus TaxID=55583 RepID=UPI00338DD820